MAFRKRTVTGYVVNPIEGAIQNATISFTPTQKIGYTSTHIVIDNTVTTTTDANGAFSIDLWCDEDSLTPIDYTVKFPKANDGQPDDQHLATFSLSYEDGSDKDIGILIQQSTPSTQIPVENLNDAIDARFAQLFDIGAPLPNGSQGGVLYSYDEQLRQDPNKFYYNPVNSALKLQDKNYVPFAGALNADVLFSVASNDNIQNNVGVVPTSNHFVAVAHDIKVNATGDGKWYIGTLTNLRVSGTTYSGSGQMIGHMIQVNNRTNLIAYPYMYGVDASLNVEGHAMEAVGGRFSAYRGSAINCARFVGVRGVAQNGYVNADEITGVEGHARAGSAGATATIARAIWAHLTGVSGHTFTNGRGVEISGWLNVASVIQNAIGLYIDNTIVGSVSSRAIKSDSTALSEFAGAIQVPDEAYSSALDGKSEALTKNSMFDYSKSIVIAGLGFPPISGVKPVNLTGFTLAVGDNDVYTVPAGYKLLIVGQSQTNNNTVSVSNTVRLKQGGNYYRLSATSNTPSGNNGSGSITLVLNAGESISVNVGATDLKVFFRGYLIPDTMNFYNIRTIFVKDPTNATTTYYTVPAGKKAVILGGGGTTYGNLYGGNDSGGARTYLVYVVPNGQVAGATYQVIKQTSTNINNAAWTVLSIPSVLDAGDTIQIAADSTVTGHQLWFSVAEVDA